MDLLLKKKKCRNGVKLDTSKMWQSHFEQCSFEIFVCTFMKAFIFAIKKPREKKMDVVQYTQKKRGVRHLFSFTSSINIKHRIIESNSCDVL